MSSAVVPSAKRRRASTIAPADAAESVEDEADDPLMRGSGGSGTVGGSGTRGNGSGSGSGSSEEAADTTLAEVMVNIFKSASLADITAANQENGITGASAVEAGYLSPKMYFSIVPRAPSMVSRIFEMIAAVLSRGGGREASNSIGFTVVMLNGQPQVAIDVGDERFTFVVSVRIVADIYVNPTWGGSMGQFPVFRVRCRSMVEKLSQAKDFNRVILYQNQGHEDQLEVLVDTPERAGNVQHETVKIQADEWEALELDNITHDYTLQTTIKTLLQLCRMQRETQGHMSISIYGKNTDLAAGGSGAAAATARVPSSSATATTAATGDTTSTAVTRQRQEYILKLDVVNGEGEMSSVLRPIANEVERRTDPRTGQTTTTMHFVEDTPVPGLRLLEELPTYQQKYHQSFSTGYIEAFLSKFDPNKMVTMRMAADKPMVLSYLHGGLLVCQMVVSPVFEEPET